MNRERNKEKIKRLMHTQFIGPRPLGEGRVRPLPTGSASGQAIRGVHKQQDEYQRG